MKTTAFVTLTFLVAFNGNCQHIEGPQAAYQAAMQSSAAENAYRQQQAYQAAQKAAAQAKIQQIYSKDPWRVINGTTNRSGGDGWHEFQGRVTEILPGGIVMKGKFGPVLTVEPQTEDSLHLVKTTEANGTVQRTARNTATVSSEVQDTSLQSKLIYGDDIFYVEGFPYPSTVGQGFQELMAMDGAYFSYTNEQRLVTIPRLIYGTPCVKVFSPEEIAAAKNVVDAKKKAIDDRVLKSNQAAADRGDAYGLLRMGERYRDGDGVEKNLVKARQYLELGAAAGSPTAADDLKHLDPQSLSVK